MIQIPAELEAMALREGWRFEVEADDWICPECIVRRTKAEEN
jgi:rubredoxin